MVGRSRYIRQTHQPRQQITYTRRARHLPDEAGPSQPAARGTWHRGNEEAGPSHTRPDSLTTLHVVVVEDEVVKLNVHYLIYIIELLVLI